MKKHALQFFFGVLFSLVSATSVLAETGFVESPLWLFPESPKEGETVTLSALFRNTEKYTLSGTVLFYDGEVLLDEKTVRIAPGGVSTASISFRIGAGTHDFRAAIGGLTEVSSAGKTIPVAIPLESASMRKLVVSKDTPLTKLTAQVKSANEETPSDTESNSKTFTVFAQVNAFEDAIVSVIPDSVKETASETVESVDTWRQEQVQNFTASRDEAKKESEEHSKKVDAVKAKKGTLSPSDKFVDGPWATIKSIVFAVLTFIFSLPVLFYVIGGILAFIVLRFIIRRIVRIVRGAKDSYHNAHIPKAPSI